MDKFTSNVEEIYDAFSQKMTNVANVFSDAISSSPQSNNSVVENPVDIGQIVTNTNAKKQQTFSTDPELKTLDDLDKAYIQQRDEQIKSLHSDMIGIHHLFKDISVLIDDQAPMIDSIAENITKAGDYVEGANEDLKEAKETQSNTNKWIFLGVSAGTITTVLGTALLILLI